MLSSDEFGEFDGFKSGFERMIQRMISEFGTIVKDENLRGKWKINEIDGDGVKGYVLQGRFESGQPWKPFDPFQPFEPMNPVRPLPRPQRPFARLPESALKEVKRFPAPIVIKHQDHYLICYIDSHSQLADTEVACAYIEAQVKEK